MSHDFLTCTVLFQVFESGSLYSPKALDIKQDDLLGFVASAINTVAAISLQLNYPTMASIPHSVVNGYKNVLAVAVATEYTFPLADKVKAYLADPSAFASAAPAAETAAAPAAAAGESKKAEKEPEPEEESDEDMGACPVLQHRVLHAWMCARADIRSCTAVHEVAATGVLQNFQTTTSLLATAAGVELALRRLCSALLKLLHLSMTPLWICCTPGVYKHCFKCLSVPCTISSLQVVLRPVQC